MISFGAKKNNISVKNSFKHIFVSFVLLSMIFALSSCSINKNNSNDRATYLRKTKEPLQIFTVDSTLKANPPIYDVALKFSTHAKLCAYGLPQYASILAKEYQSSLNPNSTYYLLFQKRNYDWQFRQCLSLMKFRNNSNLPQTSNTNQTLVSTKEFNNSKNLLKQNGVETQYKNSYTQETYAQALHQLQKVEVKEVEDVLRIIDDFYALNNHEEAEYWITLYRLITYQDRRTDVKLGRHLFQNEATRSIGYGIIVNYVRNSHNIKRLQLLNRPEFITYREAFPYLQQQYEQLQHELELESDK